MNDEFQKRLARLEAKHGTAQQRPVNQGQMSAPIPRPMPVHRTTSTSGSGGTILRRLIVTMFAILIVPASIAVGAITYVSYKYPDQSTPFAGALSFQSIAESVGYVDFLKSGDIDNGPGSSVFTDQEKETIKEERALLNQTQSVETTSTGAKRIRIGN